MLFKLRSGSDYSKLSKGLKCLFLVFLCEEADILQKVLSLSKRTRLLSAKKLNGSESQTHYLQNQYSEQSDSHKYTVLEIDKQFA